jgi:hypothetical protein
VVACYTEMMRDATESRDRDVHVSKRLTETLEISFRTEIPRLHEPKASFCDWVSKQTLCSDPVGRERIVEESKQLTHPAFQID